MLSASPRKGACVASFAARAQSATDTQSLVLAGGTDGFHESLLWSLICSHGATPPYVNDASEICSFLALGRERLSLRKVAPYCPATKRGRTMLSWVLCFT
ncbi:hypothetical protein E2C01_063806 [Portunus trituberculatus]|uniref:Uncharacterized protein n=1 Tax=Portunus trituberculatus TaxID=210409 RepID=A0A5B7HK10_PORTR|nr:hypothetical protein [Portunus trituberculatus]